jgi:DNA modification methylase
MTNTIHGDCLEVLRGMAAASVDSIVTDPPYGLSFMGKRWDYDVPSEEIWRECLRVLKPGGHLLAFAGTRTQHRMAVRIEDAGFEIRDMIAWVYGSGFPKSLDVSKAIDKAAGAEREVVGIRTDGRGKSPQKINNHGQGDTGIGHADGSKQTYCETAPATESARQWQGWGTALKPALEPITMARKPLDGTVADNALTHSTGALNIDGCRVATDPAVDDPRLGGAGTWSSDKMAKNAYGAYAGEQVGSSALGRWPANLIHDGSSEVIQLFPNNNPGCKPHILSASDVTAVANKSKGWGSVTVPKDKLAGFDDGDNKSAARFFYCAKASKADRDEGCEGMEERASSSMSGRRACDDVDWKADNDVTGRFVTQRRNHHPTVKPTALMRYLCRLVTPPGGTVLDPFMGSGSTGKAAVLEGFNFIGIEREAEYVEIAEARIAGATHEAEEEAKAQSSQLLLAV